jgi:hypothetical protein
VVLRLSDLRSRVEPAPVFARDVVFEPASPLDVESDEEQLVTLHVNLDSSSFRPRRRYRGQIEIATAGQAKRRILVRIDVGRSDAATSAGSS